MLLSRNYRASSFWLTLFSLALIFGPGMAISQEAEEKVDLDGLFEAAAVDRSNGNYAASAKKLKTYTELKKDNGAAWHFLGYSLHLDGKLDEAIEAHQKTTEFPEFKQFGLYNLGCAYSLKNQPEKALKFLNAALDSGFDLFEYLDPESGDWDADLNNVRKTEGFKAIQERAKNNGKPPKKVPEKISEATLDVKSLVGEWKITSGAHLGEEIAKDRLPVVTFTAKDVTIPAGDDSFVMSYKFIKPGKDRVEVDFKIESGPAPEGEALAIMKVDGNKATLCYDPTGQNRPKEFKTTKDDGNFMFVLEKTSAKFDPSKVVGKWNVSEGTRAGEKVTADRLAVSKITFDKDMITIPAGDDEFKMSYEINANASPIQIDMKVESGPAPEGSAAVGILKFEDGKFILCYNATGGERPEKFESTEADGNFLFTMTVDKE